MKRTIVKTAWRRWEMLVSYSLALLFLVTGAGKLAEASLVSEHFESWGYPIWFLHVTAAFELAGAVLLLFGVTRFLGATILAVVMIGALFTHVIHGEWLRAIVPALLLAVFSWIATEPRRIESRRYTAARNPTSPVNGNTPAAPE